MGLPGPGRLLGSEGSERNSMWLGQASMNVWSIVQIVRVLGPIKEEGLLGKNLTEYHRPSAHLNPCMWSPAWCYSTLLHLAIR